jgi:hypothetical protein
LFVLRLALPGAGLAMGPKGTCRAKAKAKAEAKLPAARQFPPAGHRFNTYQTRVYTLREETFVRVNLDPPRALRDFKQLVAADPVLSQWVATHVCMYRARAVRGAWMRTTETQRDLYVQQLLRHLEGPNEAAVYYIE